MMRMTLRCLLILMACVVGARAGGGESIDLFIESGELELSFAVIEPGGIPQTFEFRIDLTDLQRGGSSVFEDYYFKFDGLVIYAEFSFALYADGDFGQILLTPYLSIEQSGSQFQGAARLRTSEALVFRLLDTVELSGSSPTGSMQVIPISGENTGGRLCPGSYAAVFDDVVQVNPSDSFDSASSALDWQLFSPFDPGVRFVSGFESDINVTGNITEADGTKQSASFNGSISSDYACASGCTSGGLGDGYGYAELTAGIDSLSNGAFRVWLDADADASQNAGYQGTVFIGANAQPLVLELDKEKAFTLSKSPGVSIRDPQGEDVTGSRMGPGRFSIELSVSASLAPGQASESDSGGLTLQLRDPPCNAADFALPSGILDFNDVLDFLNAFSSEDSSADLAVPIGIVNFNDVLAFLTAFGLGCP